MNLVTKMKLAKNIFFGLWNQKGFNFNFHYVQFSICKN